MIILAFAEMDEDEDGEITQEEFIKVKVDTQWMRNSRLGGASSFPQSDFVYESPLQLSYYQPMNGLSLYGKHWSAQNKRNTLLSKNKLTDSV